MIIIPDNAIQSVVSTGMFHIFGLEVAELRSSRTGNFHLLMGFFFLDGGTYSNLMNVVSVGLLPILVFFH